MQRLIPSYIHFLNSTTKRVLLSLIYSITFALISPNCSYSDTNALVNEITDGDTIRIKIGSQTVRVRLIGIDAPEKEENDKAYRDAERSGQSIKKLLKAGEASREYLQKLLHRGDLVKIENDKEKFDRYGRMLGYVFLSDGTMINEKIIADGYAGTYTIKPNVRYKDKFFSAMKSAKDKKLGLWGQNIKLSTR